MYIYLYGRNHGLSGHGAPYLCPILRTRVFQLRTRSGTSHSTRWSIYHCSRDPRCSFISVNRRAHSLACQVKPKPGLLVESLEGEMISPYWPPICSLPVYSLPSTVYKSPRVLNWMRLCEFSVTSRAIIYENLSVWPVREPVPRAVCFNI